MDVSLGKLMHPENYFPIKQNEVNIQNHDEG